MASGRILPNTWFSAFDKLERGIWPWTTGIRSRFPLHYKKRLVEKYMKAPKPVNYVPDNRRYWMDKWGELQRVQNVPIPIIYPRESDTGLWGGEGIVEGHKKKNNDLKKERSVKLWKPGITNRIFYSEILDIWMAIDVTARTLDQIDECGGFDYYILKTHEVDLKSKLGMQLKRKMILTLIKKSTYTDQPQRQQEIYQKYQEFILPEEEVEWLGLDLLEAEAKQQRLEEEERIRNIKPFKDVYLREFIQKLKDRDLEEDSSDGFLKKLNPFKDEKAS